MDLRRREKILFLVISILLLFLLQTKILAEDKAAQTITMRIDSICLLSVSKNPEPLVINPMPYAGNIPSDALESSSHLHYSSAVARGQSRSITALWEPSDSAPSGCELLLQAFPSNRKNEGTSAGEIVLSTFPQVIVRDIGSCATGSGPENGARLNYRLRVTNIENMVAGDSKTATVTFTLMDIF